MLAAVMIMIAQGSGVAGCPLVKRPVKKYDRRGHDEVVVCVAEYVFLYLGIVRRVCCL